MDVRFIRSSTNQRPTLPWHRILLPFVRILPIEGEGSTRSRFGLDLNVLTVSTKLSASRLSFKRRGSEVFGVVPLSSCLLPNKVDRVGEIYRKFLA